MMGTIETQSLFARLRLEEERQEDYDFIFGDGAYQRIMNAKESGVIIMWSEEEKV